MIPRRFGPAQDQDSIFVLGAPAVAVRVRFIPDDLADPLALFPTLRSGNRPYNMWLTEEILGTFLERWARRSAAAFGVAADVDAACQLSRQAFSEVLPAAARAGGAAVLAALAVTANLLRTMTFLGEALGEGRPAAAAPAAMSRAWCGFVIRQECRRSALSCGKGLAAAPAGRDLRDLRQLAGALASSPAAIEALFAEAIETLRGEIRHCGLFTADDLRHLQGGH